MSQRVIFYLRQSTERIGGAEVVIRRTVGALDKQRYKVIVLLLKKPGTDLTAVKNLLGDSGCTLLELEDRKLIDRSVLQRILAYLKEYKPDIIHCHDPKTDVYGWLLRLIRPGIPVMSTLHGWTQRGRKGRFFKKIDILVARRFHSLVAVSPLIEKEARKRGLDKVHLIENGIPVDSWRQLAQTATPPLKKEKGESWVGFVGRLTAEKGPLEFIETATRIAQKAPTTRFIIAGDGPLLDAMKNLAHGKNIETRCQFLGMVPLDQMPGLLKSFDVMLSTSATEGLPNNLLEAGALGIPIVATSVGGVPLVVKDGYNGYLAPFRAHGKLAARVVELLEDRQRWQQFSTHGLTHIREHFDISVTAGKLAHLYESLLTKQ